MKKITTVTLLMSSLAFLVPSTYAGTVFTSAEPPTRVQVVHEEIETVKESGLYLEGNLGYGRTHRKLRGLSINGVDITNPDRDARDKGLAANATLGLKLNRNLAIEAGYTYLPDVVFRNVSSNVDLRSTHNHAIHAAVKAILPLQDKFSIFGKLGVASLHRGALTTKTQNITVTYPYDKKRSTELYAAAGVSVGMSENLEANIQYVHIGRAHKAQAVMAGLTYLF